MGTNFLLACIVSVLNPCSIRGRTSGKKRPPAVQAVMIYLECAHDALVRVQSNPSDHRITNHLALQTMSCARCACWTSSGAPKANLDCYAWGMPKRRPVNMDLN